MTQPDSRSQPSSHRRTSRSLASVHLGVLITIKRDGRPQSSNIGYAYDATTQASVDLDDGSHGQGREPAP